MQTKTLEIRDEGTMICALAVDINPDSEEQRFLMRRCGYPCDGRPNIILADLGGRGKSTNDPYDWKDRTWQAAHFYILEHWLELKDGDVVDVEYILHETDTPKVSARFT